ncbi:MAG: phosphodiester glycosidase family protein [Polyangiaceae bacterium]
MRTRAALAVSAGLLACPLARAGVSDPHPGIRVVDNGATAMVVADLCAAGVSVRATKYAERNATAATWAKNVDAEVAINADFFDFPGWSWVIGRARGAGEDWPADKQLKEVRSYWQFGPTQAGLVPNAATEPSAGVTDIVGGHNILIDAGVGKGPLFDGDAVLQGKHRRTSIGLSADHRYLYFFVSDTLLNGDGMVTNLVSHASQASAPPIAWATNQDGGGSSQLYVKGLGSVISSTRPVNNHLGIFAKGAGPAVNCNHAPEGWLDAADADGARGWTRDVDAPDAAIEVHLYWGGAAGTGAPASTTTADLHRDDLCAALGSCAHGFTARVPLSLLDGQAHPVHAYGIDSSGGANAELSGSPGTLQATMSPLMGKRRHVVDPPSYAAWKFDEFWDRLPAANADVEALKPGADLPGTPTLVRADDGSPQVFVLDGDVLRHVASPEVMQAWRFDFGAVESRSAADLAALSEGEAWPARPVTLVSDAGAVYVLDAPDPVTSGGGSGGSWSAGGAGGVGGGDAGKSSSGTHTAKSGEESSCSVSAGRPPREVPIWLFALLALGAQRRRRWTASQERADSAVRTD